MNKNVIIICSIFLLSIQFQINAQYRQLRLAKEELEKIDFDKSRVLEKIKKYEKDEGTTPESMYLRNKFLVKTAIDLISIDSAYIYFNESFREIENYDQKKKDELCKEITFCETNKDIENNELELLLYSKYSFDNNLNTIELFIKKYSYNLYINKAIRLRDSIEFVKVKSLNDEIGLESYLKKRPGSYFFSEAEYLLYTVGFEKIKNSNKVEKYLEYIKKYPNSPYLKDAIDFITTKNWEEIVVINNKDLYLKHIADFPSSKYLEIAKKKIEDIDWRIVLEADNLVAYERFAKDYPNSNYQDLVNQKIKEFKEQVLPYLNKNKKYTLLNLGTLKFVNENDEFDTMVALPKGKFVVSKYNKYGVIDLLGNKIIPITYDCIRNEEDVFILKLGEKFGVYNNLGNKIVDFAFEDIYLTENKNFIVSKKYNNKDNTYGLISSTGEGIFDAKYNNITEINPNTYCVTLEGLTYLVDEKENIKSLKYNSISLLSNINKENQILLVELKNKKGLINSKGEIIIPLNYETILDAGENKIISVNLPKQGLLYGIVDQLGNQLLPPKYRDIFYCGKNLFAIDVNTITKSKNKNFQLYDLTTSEFKTKDSYDSIGTIEDNGLIRVEKNNLIGYINEYGIEIVNPIYKSYSGKFDENENDDSDQSCYVFNKEEDLLDNSYDHEQNLTLVDLSDKIGYINNKGEIVIPIIYLYGNDFNKGITTVTDFSEVNKIIDEKGNVLLDNAEILYYYNNSKSVLAKQNDSYFKIDTESHLVEPYTLLKDIDNITHFKKYKIINYKDVEVYVTYKNQILMANAIDFSDYMYTKKVKEAMNFYYSGDYDQSIQLLTELLKENNKVFNVALLLGKCYRLKGEINSAVDYFTRAINIEPNNTEAYYEKFSLNYERKYWSDAKDDLLKLMNLDPVYIDSYAFNLAYCYSQTNNNNEAFNIYCKILRTNPKNSTSLNNRGVIYQSRGEYQLAFNDYINALKNSKYEDDESKGLYLNNAGNMASKIGKKVEACAYWSKGAALGNADCIQNKRYNCK